MEDLMRAGCVKPPTAAGLEHLPLSPAGFWEEEQDDWAGGGKGVHCLPHPDHSPRELTETHRQRAPLKDITSTSGHPCPVVF
jgi:hypothetical protein